ncbi:MAG: polysaccharide deacetylase family protein [Chthoniobacter sp.]|nr:polysaccharide deacetylase family protein [Chthoniobacter sp.]
MPASATPKSWIRPCLLTANYAAPLVLFATRFRYPWLIAGAVVVHACFFYAIVAPSCGWLVRVATRFRPKGSEVWLTIDDGPDGEASLRLSEEMSRRGVQATFFVKGRNLERQPEVGAALVAAGHSLANHTQTHPAHLFWWLRPGALRREIDACNEALRSAGVSVIRWFRSPVGLKNVFLEPTLRRRDMRYVGWSVRGHDGVTCEPEAVARRVGERVSPGAIVLLHEGRARSNEAILRVIDELRERGYSFVIPADEQLV